MLTETDVACSNKFGIPDEQYVELELLMNTVRKIHKENHMKAKASKTRFVGIDKWRDATEIALCRSRLSAVEARYASIPNDILRFQCTERIRKIGLSIDYDDPYWIAQGKVRPKPKRKRQRKPTPQWYIDYLAGEHWQEVRRQCLEFWNHHCCLCTSTDSPEVHHNNYDCLNCETLSDVVCVCREHHELVHFPPDKKPLLALFDLDKIG